MERRQRQRKQWLSVGDIAGERPGQGEERQETKENRREKATVRRGGYVEEER